MNPSAYETLLDFISSLAIIDTHEHLAAFEMPVGGDVLLKNFSSYLSHDVISAGLPQHIFDTVVANEAVPLMKKWRVLAPFWPYVRYTGYGRATTIAARELYGIDTIDEKSVEDWNARFLSAHKSGGHYQRILKEKCNIETCVLDGWQHDVDSAYFHPAEQVMHMVYGDDGNLWQSAQARTGCTLHTFDDLLEAVDRHIETRLTDGAVCLKCTLAYHRSLHFPETDIADVRADLQRMREGRDPGVGKNCTALQNYMMHHILKTVNRLGGVIQFHTGIQAGNGNYLEWTNPIHLTNLFLAYPNVKFDLFHIGYPFWNTATVLAKNFQNVFIDMCWAHIISPADSITALGSFLDTVPCNKISAFGGDFGFIDGIVGHLWLARENVARTLTQKIADGRMDMDDAKYIAQRLFYANPKELFGL